MQPKDFSRRKHFPGLLGGSFAIFLHADERIERIPALAFAGFLFLIALIPTRANLPLALGLWIFFLSDWVLLAALPRAGKSFGPAKPQTFVLAIPRALFAVLPLPFSLIAEIIGTALVVYGFWIEPHRLRVTQQTLQSAKLKPGAPPLRVLHLGDLHIERMTDRERQVVDYARSLKPDLILFSGDFLSFSHVHDPVAWDHARQVLRELSAPLGVYAVTGSQPVDEPSVVAQLLDGLDIRWLRDERILLNHHDQRIDVVGVTCTHKPHLDGATLDDILHGDPDDFTILLYHTPDLAPIAAQQGVDLQLSGHTHAGQVRLPWFGAIYTSSLYYKRFEAGRYTLGALTLYVTRGIGLEGRAAPRVRFLCSPEIVLWEISA